MILLPNCCYDAKAKLRVTLNRTV